MEYLSKQRYDEIAAELKHLIGVVYPKVKDDLAAGKISLKSPIGAALMDRKVGEIVEAIIRQAKSMLSSTSLTVQEIADALGFQNQSHFGTFFHRYTGINPTSYRRSVSGV